MYLSRKSQSPLFSPNGTARWRSPNGPQLPSVSRYRDDMTLPHMLGGTHPCGDLRENSHAAMEREPTSSIGRTLPPLMACGSEATPQRMDIPLAST